MRHSRRSMIVAGLFLLSSVCVASAATVIRVDLWDKGSAMDMPKGLAYGQPGLDLAKATMGLKLSRASAPAGIVSFKVTNQSKDMIHEMIVIALPDPAHALPYIDKESRVDEDKALDKGEVSELDPGKSGTLTIPLKAGHYLLICNVPGHYAAGMWSALEITK